MSGKGGKGGASPKNWGSASYISYLGYLGYIGYMRWVGNGRGGCCAGWRGRGGIRGPDYRQRRPVAGVSWADCTSWSISIGCAGVESE